MSPVIEPRRVSHLGIQVSDLARSLAFYEDVLGYKLFLDYRHGALPGHETVIGMIGDLAVELIHDPNVADHAATPVPIGLGYACVSFSVDDLDAAGEALRANGVEATPVLQFPAARVVFFRDPDGNLLELINVDGAETIGDLSTPLRQRSS